jgi:hypothetical protein
MVRAFCYIPMSLISSPVFPNVWSGTEMIRNWVQSQWEAISGSGTLLFFWCSPWECQVKDTLQGSRLCMIITALLLPHSFSFFLFQGIKPRAFSKLGELCGIPPTWGHFLWDENYPQRKKQSLTSPISLGPCLFPDSGHCVFSGD